MRGKLMDLLLNGFGPLNASEEILTKLCLPLHFPSPLLYFMCLSLSLIPYPPPLLFPHPLSLSLFSACRQMLATVFSERPDLATWTRPWITSRMASI